MANISESTGKDIPTYTIALTALFDPAHEEFFNSLISGLKISACQFMINFMYVMNTVFYIKILNSANILVLYSEFRVNG